MIDHECVPYKRKTLYLFLTIPIVLLYITIGILLWQRDIVSLIIYVSLFVLIPFFMSIVCVYWQCPYVGRFAPCVGGFCLPASQIARLFKNVIITKKRYQLFLSLAYLVFFGIIIFPMYLLFMTNPIFLLIYIFLVLVYWAVFTLFICPHCATRFVCPGGQMAVEIQKKIDSHRVNENRST